MSIDGRVASVWTRFALSSHDAPQNLNMVKIERTRFLAADITQLPSCMKLVIYTPTKK